MQQLRYGMNVIALSQAELAMGASKRLMDDFYTQKRMGWHHYWSPDRAMKRAATHESVKKLIWC